MKAKFYLACTLAVSMLACQKQILLPEEQTPLKLKANNSLMYESDGFFQTFKPSPDYQMQFTERFKTNNIGTNGEQWWTPRTKTVAKFYFNGYNREANLSVSNERLSINFNTDPDGKYYGGGIISNKKFGYGYYEARVRNYTATYGLHQSFWSADDSSTIVEIDGAETDSKRSGGSTLHPSRHQWRPSQIDYHLSTAQESSLVQVPNTTLGVVVPGDDGVWTDTDGVWYNVGYEWLPEGIKVYIDGVYKTTLDTTDFHLHTMGAFAPQSVQLSALPLRIDSVTSMVVPQPGAKMQVKYFAYYAKPLPNTNLLGNYNFSSVFGSAATYIKEMNVLAWDNTSTSASPPTMTLSYPTTDQNNIYVSKIANNWRLEHKNATQAYKAGTYQTLNWILPGTYTVSCRIRSSAGGSRIIVLDKDKTIIDQIVIQTAHNDWINVTKDINVTANEVTILIYSDAAAGAWFQVDDIKFALKP